MAAPRVEWFDVTNTTAVTTWNLNTVDAGTISTSSTFLVWNNRGGVTAVSDMESCTITTKDAAGGNTGELVTNKWIEVKVDTLAEATFTPIGGVNTKAIRAGGTVVTSGVIKGIINDGTLTGAALDCHAKVTLQANVPATATAGNVDFLTRVAYLYT